MIERFWRFGKPYAGRYAAGFVLLLATNALGLSIPWLLRRAIDGLREGGDFAWLTRIAAAILGVAALQAVFRTSSRLAILGASRRIVHDVRRRFFSHLQRLGSSFWDAQRTGDVMSRGVNDVQLLQAFYGPGLMNLLNTSIVYVAAWTLLFGIDARLAAAALLVYPPLLFVVNRLSKRTYRYSMEVQETLAELSNRVQENLSGIQQIKTYVQEEREIARFREDCETFRDRNLSMVRVRGAMMSVIGIAAGITTLLVLWLGGRHVIEGRITLGEFVAFNAYLAMLAWPTIALGWIINVFQRGAGSMRRLTAFLETEASVPLPPIDEPEPRPLGKLEVRGLDFTYEGADRPTLTDVSLEVGPGERVALVGEVGSGKSTLVQLISRLYEPPRGTVFLGGRDVLDIPLDELRRDLGVVPQESFLFSRTIRENVALRRPQALAEELADAVERAHLASDLDRFPDGLETMVGERGVTLSGGQRQRVALARALMTGPSLLLLDDALSSVDSDTEQAILDRFLKGSEGRGCLFVSHRLSTLAGMDRIVVLQGGVVVEEGTHEELLEREDGAYRRLFLRRELERSLGEGA